MNINMQVKRWSGIDRIYMQSVHDFVELNKGDYFQEKKTEITLSLRAAGTSSVLNLKWRSDPSKFSL